MVKVRVATRIKEAVNGKKSMNRSVDLVALTQRYQVMKKKLNRLATALHKHHNLIKDISKSRLNVRLKTKYLQLRKTLDRVVLFLILSFSHLTLSFTGCGSNY